ncbi:MAG TPA: hypothetical protein VGI03_06150 [Verrucomicrobiae bacterium]
MKKHLAKMTLMGICAAAIFVAPALSRAQDTSTNAPATSATAPHKKHTSLPFHGNLAAVDTNAMTLTVGSMTFQVTSKTKITKDGQPAELGDGVVGQPVSGAYRKTEDATNATTIHFGAKMAATAAPASN